MPAPLAAVVLAAGGSRRMGENKLLLPWKGKPLLVHVLETALGASTSPAVTVVLGNEAERITAALAAHFAPPFPFATTRNPEWEEGQSSSLRHGLDRVAADETVAGVMFLLGDQPQIQSRTLDLLIAAHRASPTALATAPTYRHQRGNPVILSRALFPRLAELRGDAGARGIVDSLGEGLLLVPVDDPGVRRDVDTPEAYAELGGCS